METTTYRDACYANMVQSFPDSFPPGCAVMSAGWSYSIASASPAFRDSRYATASNCSSSASSYCLSSIRAFN